MSDDIHSFLHGVWAGYHCPLNADNYRCLLAIAQRETDERAVALLAEFRSHWQLSLDCNLGGELRATFKSKAETNARHLADLLLELE